MPLDPPAVIAILGGGSAAIEAALYGRFLGYRIELVSSGPLFATLQARAAEPLPHAWNDVTTPLGQAALEAQRPDQPIADLNRPLKVSDWIAGYLQPLTESDLLADSIHAEQSLVSIVPRETAVEEAEDDEFEAPAASYDIVLRDVVGDDASYEVNAIVDCEGDFTTPGLRAIPHYFSLQESLANDSSLPTVAQSAAAIRQFFAQLFGRDDLDLYERMRKAGGSGR